MKIQETIAEKLFEYDNDIEEGAETQNSANDGGVEGTGTAAREKRRLIALNGLHGKKHKIEKVSAGSIESMTEGMGLTGKYI